MLAPRRLSAPERHGLYMGLERRNQVLLLEPRDHRTDHLANPDMLALARGVRAAAQLAEAASSGERRSRFERIARERTQEIVRLLKSVGLVYVRIDEWAETPDRTVFEEESLGAASTREEVLSFLRTQLFPGALFEEHLRDRLDDLFDQRVDRIDRTYRNTLGFPVPLTVGMVSGALISLVEHPARIAGPAAHPGPFLRRARHPLGAGARSRGPRAAVAGERIAPRPPRRPGLHPGPRLPATTEASSRERSPESRRRAPSLLVPRPRSAPLPIAVAGASCASRWPRGWSTPTTLSSTPRGSPSTRATPTTIWRASRLPTEAP